MLRVLFVTGASHERYMVNLNHYQRVHFLSRQAQLTIFGVKGADFSASATAGTVVVRAPYRGKIGVVFYFLYWLLRTRRSSHFDIVLTEPSKLCICGLFAKTLLGCKWVVDVWDIPFRGNRRGSLRRCLRRLDRRIARRLFRRADLFILSILPHLEFAEFEVPQGKMLLLKNAIWLTEPTGAAPESVSARGEPFSILCMRSRFAYDMGLDVLSQAFDILQRTHSDVKLTIVGKIPEDLRPQVAPLSGCTNVCFREFVEHDELVSLIASSHACVIPFRNTTDLAQTFPIKVLEYLACGVVVVAPSLPGIRCMIRHEENGLLFRPDDPLDLAEKLRRIYEDRELATAVARRAKVLGDEYDCRKKADVIFEALGKLAG
jgi:glycosyltransferase involved in cell wall biosynthesis